MAGSTAERISLLFEGGRRNRRILVSPEGVPLDIQIARHGERLTAFVLDMTFMLTAVICLYFIVGYLFFSSGEHAITRTLLLFFIFLITNFYFLHFELAWQGRTPGKRICGLRVINRSGGELTPSAVIARNLTRELEVFLPIKLFFILGLESGGWAQLAMLGWATVLSSLPLWGRDHLRAGDLIGGTQVIAMPKRALLDDLSAVQSEAADAEDAYSFTPEQLAKYGAFELQVLEEFLRRPAGKEADRQLENVCKKICKKIGWEGPVPEAEVRRFLTDFYTAERADLERGQLFGRLRTDKTAAARMNKRPS